MSKSLHSLHGFVSGRVQGVFFRATTQKKAHELELTGWVRNVVDGRVEIFFSGREDSVKQMQVWLWQGPTMAKVTNVELTAIDYQEFEDFLVK